MASGHGAKTPFLNDYKLQFFWRRFPQTVSGGLRLQIGAPFYVYLYQIIVFLWPVALGAVATALVELDILQDHVSCCIYGSLMATSAISAHLLALFLVKQSSGEERTNEHNVLAEDDEVEFTSCCDKETLKFIFPAKTSILNVFVHGLLSGVLCGLTSLYLVPSAMKDVFSNTGTVVVLSIFGWLTLCVASHSLTVQPPPEMAIFRSLDNTQLTSLMRPFYVSVIAVIGVLARHYPELKDTSKVLYIFMAILPLMWTVGLLPPLDALFPWLGEQLLVFALGGTHMASDFRLFISLLLSGTVLLLACFITDYVALITFCAIFGFILSLDLPQLIEQLATNLIKLQENSNSTHKWSVTGIARHLTILVLGSAIAGVSSHFYKDATKNMFDAFGYIFIVLLILLKILGDLQYVYICDGLIRNPFYTKNAASLPALKKFKNQIRHCGWIYNILHTYVCPLIMVAFLGMFLHTLKQDLSAVAVALGTVRALRWVWQNTLKCLLEMTILSVTVWCTLDIEWWDSLGVGLQLLMIGLIYDRVNDFIQKAKFMLAMFITSWTEPKQRHKATIPTLIISLVLFPLVLLILLISVVLSAPLNPLFSFPLFFVGFPRPKRMWPSLLYQSSGSSEGSVYYEQLVPKVLWALQDPIANGTLVSMSDFILVRYQDKFIIIQMLERGYKYCTVVARGLELQETSCHTVEAAMVDDIFEEAFCKERNSSFGVNHFVLNALTPSQCIVVKTYSDAHNVLTGVIDQPENIEKQSINFVKCMIWVLLKQHENNLSNQASSVRQNIVQTEESSEQPNESKILKNSGSTSATAKRAAPTTTPVESICNSSSTKILDREWSDPEWSEDDEEETEPTNGGSPADPMSFGLPAQDIGKPANSSKFRSEPTTKLAKNNPEHSKKSSSAFPQTKVVPLYSNMQLCSSTEFEQPFAWVNLLSCCRKALPHIHLDFPQDWFNYVCKNCSVVLQSNEAVESKVKETLCDLYKDIVMCCFAVVNMLGLHGSVVKAGAGHIYRVYQGRIPWSPELDIMEQDSELKELVLEAFRYAFKLTYDEAVLGAMDDEELLENLNDYKENWFIGIEHQSGWNEAILKEKSNLFSIGYDDDKGTYTSHLLTKQDLGVFTGTLNSAAVCGQWASLVFELLYLTNDDEERYSIQAHPVLLRNLTIQAADPPLGYAVYSSGPTQIPYGLF